MQTRRSSCGWQPLLMVALALSIILPSALPHRRLVPAALAAPTAGYRTLQDINIFKDQELGQWAGAGNGLSMETVNSTLPVDTTETYNSLNSYRINVTGASGGWWQAQLAGKDWNNYSLAAYYANGALEFNIKGALGGETFTLTARDRVRERAPEHLTQAVSSTSFVSVTTGWQHVRIPLSSFITSTSSFDLRQMYSISLSGSGPVKFWINDIKFTSPDDEPGFPAIKVNQLGYITQAEKYALVSGFAEELTATAGTAFQVRRSSDTTVVASGTLSLVSDYDQKVSGERVLKADFSSLTTPGSYYISVSASGIASSPVFQIGNTLYNPLLVDAARYFYYQRSGMALDPAHAGSYSRGVGHPQDTAATFRSNTSATKNVLGGWYDAGDYGKYTNAGATAVSDLLWAYELFPAQFGDSQLNIPESGNGRADLLDEIKHELDWLLKMQDATSGGFYHMVQPTGSATPDNDQIERFIEDTHHARTNVRPTSTTASAVGALAHAAMVFSGDTAYSTVLLAAARSGWAYLQANPSGVAPVSGPYADSNDADNRLWAAAALYRATGEAQYNTYFLANYQSFASVWDSTTENAHGIESMAMIAFLDYLKSSTPDSAVVSWFKTKFTGWRATQLSRSTGGVWRNTLLDYNYYWGSNMAVLNTTLVLAVGSQLTGTYDSLIAQAAQTNLNYILGVNPRRFSYVSGYGSDSVTAIYSNIWGYDNRTGIPKGYLAGGPNMYEGRWFSRFGGKAYIDVASEWTTNEHAIVWNSGLVFSAALVATEAVSPAPPPATSLKAQYRTADPIADDSQLKPSFKIVNTGATTVPLSELKIRYWFTAENANPQTYYCDWAHIGCANVAGQVVKLATARANADHYLEIDFTDTGSLAPGASSGEIQGRVAKSDWTAYDETNDYSFDVTKTTAADWNRVTLYHNGTLVWGTEP